MKRFLFLLMALFFPFPVAPAWWRKEHTVLEVWSVRFLQGVAFAFLWLPLTLLEGLEGALTLGWVGATDTYAISFLDYYGLSGVNVAKRIRLWGAQQLGMLFGSVALTSYQAGVKTAYPEIVRGFKTGVTIYVACSNAIVAGGATAYAVAWDTAVNAFRLFTTGAALSGALAELGTGAIVVSWQFIAFGQVGGN